MSFLEHISKHIEETVLLGTVNMTNMIDFYNKMIGSVHEGRTMVVIYPNFIKASDTCLPQ